MARKEAATRAASSQEEGQCEAQGAQQVPESSSSADLQTPAAEPPSSADLQTTAEPSSSAGCRASTLVIVPSKSLSAQLRTDAWIGIDLEAEEYDSETSSIMEELEFSGLLWEDLGSGGLPSEELESGGLALEELGLGGFRRKSKNIVNFPVIYRALLVPVKASNTTSSVCFICSYVYIDCGKFWRSFRPCIEVIYRLAGY